MGLSRRALIRMLAVVVVAAVGYESRCVEESMCMEAELSPPQFDADGAWFVQPTGRRVYSIGGIRVSEAAFFAAAARHSHPRMREWAQLWRKARV